MLGIYWGDKYSSLIKFRRSEKGTKFKKSSTFNLTLLSIDWWIGNCVHILFSVSTVQTFKAKKSKQNCLLFIPFKVSFLKGKSNGNCWIWNQDIQIVHRPASLSYPVPGWGTHKQRKRVLPDLPVSLPEGGKNWYFFTMFGYILRRILFMIIKKVH